MPPYGEGRRGILLVGEAPGEQEDQQGRPFVGKSGAVLRSRLTRLGVDMDRDCWRTNAINCRPPDNRKPTDKELEWCRPALWTTIAEKKPRVILLLGSSALEAFYAHRWPSGLGAISRWRGFTIPDQRAKAWVVPTFHPSFILRGQEDDVADVLLVRDLEQMLSVSAEPLTPALPMEVTCYVNPLDPGIGRRLERILTNQSVIGLDYETTGIKPYSEDENHTILSCGICDDRGAFAFRLGDLDSDNAHILREVLTDPKVPKIAHNLQFEEVWSREILGVSVRGWIWDTMLAAHFIDNRQGICGLDFQAFVMLGVEDYHSGLSTYMRSGSDNGRNRLDRAPVNDLLRYNALDALVTYHLYPAQKEWKR